MAKKTTFLIGIRARDLQAIERRIDDLARRRPRPSPEADRRRSRARAACRRTNRRSRRARRAMACARSIISSGVTQTGQPGPCTSSISRRQQMVEPVLDDRVRLAAADFHDHPRPGDGAADLVERSSARRGHRGTRQGTSSPDLALPRVSASSPSSSSSQVFVRARGLLAIHLADGEAHVDQHVVAELRRRADTPGTLRA